ncbi:MAG: hypothetical protein ABSG81_13995, partial [Acidimicrobiales bacterium]
IWGVLIYIERRYKRRPVGFVLAATMALWGLTRFYEERLWLGEIGKLGSNLVQAAGLALFVAGIVIMVVLYRRQRRKLDHDDGGDNQTDDQTDDRNGHQVDGEADDPVDGEADDPVDETVGRTPDEVEPVTQV